MVGPFEYVLWLVGLLLEVGVVVCSIYRKKFFQYLSLNIYLLLCAVANIGVYVYLVRFGVSSQQYLAFYYGADLLLCVSLYFVVIHLYHLVLDEGDVRRYIRGGAGILLSLTCLFSYAVARHGDEGLTARFAVELEQNLNFVGVVLTYLLWGAILKRRETRARLVQLVLALGIYFSAIATAYAVRGLFPQFDARGMWHWAPALISLWLPLAWLYAFMAIPDAARLHGRQIAVRAQS